MTVTEMTLQEKFEDLGNELRLELIERPTVIHTAQLALIGRLHHFQLGEPGVAKSLTVERMLSHIGGFQKSDLFKILMTRFTAPEEMFGPFDLSGLKETPSRFRRTTDLMAPEALVWFLDEVFKANPSILNSLLWALNERHFRNDGHILELPLWSMFCASNEMPEGEELNALYDRIHFRLKVEKIKEPTAFIGMLKLQNTERRGEILTWKDVEQAAEEAARVEIPNEIYDALNILRTKLRSEEGIMPTDRRFAESLKVIRAAAWMDGETVADMAHMIPLSHMLWDTYDQFPLVEKILLEMCNPLDKEAQAVLDVIEEISEELDVLLSEDEEELASKRSKKGVELNGKIDRCKNDLRKIKAAAKKNKRKSAKIQETQGRLVSVTRRMLQEVFGLEIDEDDLDDEDDDE